MTETTPFTSLFWSAAELREAPAADLRALITQLRWRAQVMFRVRNRREHNRFEREASRVERILDGRIGLPSAVDWEG